MHPNLYGSSLELIHFKGLTEILWKLCQLTILVDEIFFFFKSSQTRSILTSSQMCYLNYYSVEKLGKIYAKTSFIAFFHIVNDE